ncbi:MAG: CoA transferase [Chloroflexi bacterium]|nr:CoA transferase [Chloroflexota bacterium]
MQGNLPLRDIRVADFTWIGAGPTCTRFLAFFGAEVIIIESHTRGGIRMGQPQAKGPTGSPNLSGFFNNLNSCKESITLNMRTPQGVDVARRLIGLSDIVVNNFSPGVMDRWGLGYDELVKVNPGVIMAEMPVAGRWGPHKRMIGYGATVEAFSGINEMTGYPDRPPTGTEINYPDYASNPYHLATALLSALHYRNQTGCGQYIEVAQLESTASVMETYVLDYTVNKRVQTRTGNHAAYASPHSVYRCQGEDRWVAIAVTSEEEWCGFQRALGEPEWTKDPRYATLQGRKEHEEELDRLVEGWTSARSPQEAMRLLQAQGVPAGMVQNMEDAMERDPHLAARGFYARLEHPEAGLTRYDGLVAKLSATPGRLRAPAPLLGEHNDYVFRELLGMSEDDVNQYILKQVIY